MSAADAALPSPNEEMVDAKRLPTRVWYRTWMALSRLAMGQDVILLMRRQKASLPPATAGGVIVVTDATGGATLAWADGSSWRRASDNSVVD